MHKNTCKYVWMHHIFMYACTYVWKKQSICIYVCMQEDMHDYTFMCASIYVCVCMYVCRQTYVSLCMYIGMYADIHA